MDELVRCRWAVEHPELLEYHDTIWGTPTRDDREIFAAYGQCILHAGLLWTAMLRKRQAFREAFEGWDIVRISAYDGTDIDRLMHAEGIIRNFQKINAVIHNAGSVREVQREFGSFAAYLWRFTDNEPLVCECRPNFTCSVGRREADTLSQDLKGRGFKFSGPATAYGLMEDIGMINDHDRACFRASIIA